MRQSNIMKALSFLSLLSVAACMELPTQLVPRSETLTKRATPLTPASNRSTLSTLSISLPVKAAASTTYRVYPTNQTDKVTNEAVFQKISEIQGMTNDSIATYGARYPENEIFLWVVTLDQEGKNVVSNIHGVRMSDMVLRKNYSYQPRFPLYYPDALDLLFNYISLIFELRRGNKTFKNIPLLYQNNKEEFRFNDLIRDGVAELPSPPPPFDPDEI